MTDPSKKPLDVAGQQKRSLEPHVRFMPTGVKCPECYSQAKRLTHGKGDYWTQLYKGEQFVCTSCGLQFSSKPRPFEKEKRSYTYEAEQKALKETLRTVPAGEKKSLIDLQASYQKLKRTYYEPKPVEPTPVKPTVPRVLPFKWHQTVPITDPDTAGDLAGTLEKEGFVVDIAVIQDPKSKWRYFTIDVRKPKEGEKAHTNFNFKDEDLAILPLKEKVEITGEYHAHDEALYVKIAFDAVCVRCKTPYIKGMQVLKISGKPYCPKDGGYLEPTVIKPTMKPSTVVGTPTALPTSVENTAILTSGAKCTRCHAEYNSGERVLKIASYLYCPRDGGFLETK